MRSLASIAVLGAVMLAGTSAIFTGGSGGGPDDLFIRRPDGALEINKNHPDWNPDKVYQDCLENWFDPEGMEDVYKGRVRPPSWAEHEDMCLGMTQDFVGKVTVPRIQNQPETLGELQSIRTPHRGQQHQGNNHVEFNLHNNNKNPRLNLNMMMRSGGRNFLEYMRPNRPVQDKEILPGGQGGGGGGGGGAFRFRRRPGH